MTPDDFEELLRRSSCDEFVAKLNVLDESERKPLLKVIKTVRKEISGKTGGDLSTATAAEWKKVQKTIEKWRGKNPFVESNIALALLGCGSAAEAHRVELWTMRWEKRNFVSSVLIARNPVWLDTWVNKRLDSEFPELSWEMVREFLQAGVIEKPVSEGYMTLFIQAMCGFNHRDPASYVPTSERLKREPEFLEDEVWRIFEFENHALTTDWSGRRNDAPANYETWPEAFIHLASNGDIDRDRLLSLTLSSMQKEMKQNQLSAYGKLHEALAPDKDEMVALQQGYLDLLVSPIGPVLSFAVKMLDKLHRAGKLDVHLFADAIRPVFAHKAKGTAMRALKILNNLDTDDDKCFQSVADAAIVAMAHQSPDVQEFALSILGENFTKLSESTIEAVEQHVPFLSLKLQQRASKMFGRLAENDQSSMHAAQQDLDPLAVAQSLTPELRELVGIGEAMGKVMPTTLQYDLLDLPNVVERDVLVPVSTRDELLELASRLLERVESPDQVELLLHGISRFGRDRGGDFKKLTAPLIQRVEQGQSSSDGLCAGWDAISFALVDLLMTWWTNKRYDSRRTPYYEELPQVAFTVARIREIQKNLLGTSESPLVSLPSYRNGWVDPKEFVQRILKRKEKQEVPQYDLMQAFLRLGPGNREQALRLAADVSGKAGRLIRFALGGNESPKWTDRRDAHRWYCAARARNPQLEDGNLLNPIAGKIPDLPGIFHTSTWKWHVKLKKHEGYRIAGITLDEGLLTEVDRGNTFSRDLIKEAKKKLTEPAWLKWPTAGQRTWPPLRWFAMYQYGSPWRVEWFAMQHPADTESLMSVAVRMLDFRSDENTSRDAPVHAFFSALFDLTRPWGEMTHLAICLGLLSRSSDSCGYATDALIPAIESGHADCHCFVDVFSKLLTDGAYKINRFEPAMTAILGVSDLHKWWVGSLVNGMVVQFDTAPKGAYFLYEVALECMLPLNVRPTDAMVARLKEHKGSSKTAKLAKELLSLKGPAIDEPDRALINAAWVGRQRLADSLSG